MTRFLPSGKYCSSRLLFTLAVYFEKRKTEYKVRLIFLLSLSLSGGLKTKTLLYGTQILCIQGKYGFGMVWLCFPFEVPVYNGCKILRFLCFSKHRFYAYKRNMAL